MNTSFSPTQVDELRRTAKRLARQQAIPHHQALDRVAKQHGYRNWSLLSKHSAAMPPASAPAASKQAALPVGPPAAPPAPAVPPSDPRRRYYLHGDQYEEDPARYYCASCDVFFDASHFTTHGPHTGERFLDSLEHWKKRDWRSQLNNRRPDNAVNMLEAQAVAARAEYQALRPAFSAWLWGQRKRRDRVGFLAAGLMSARGLPTTPKSLPRLYQHYERYGKSYHGLAALYDAWAEFKKQLP